MVQEPTVPSGPTAVAAQASSKYPQPQLDEEVRRH